MQVMRCPLGGIARVLCLYSGSGSGWFFKLATPPPPQSRNVACLVCTWLSNWYASNVFSLVTSSCTQAKGSAKDLGKGLPDPSDAADQAKGLASDAKSKVKEEANVAGDVSDLPNPFDGAGGIADQVPILLLLTMPKQAHIWISCASAPYCTGKDSRAHEDAR